MMSRRYIASILSFLCLLLCCLSCQKEGPKVLPKKAFSQVLADVYLTDAMLKQLDTKTKREWTKGLRNDYFQDISYHWILDKHHLTEADFYASVSHYSRQPKHMIELLEMTEACLEAMKQDLAKREEAEILRQKQLEFDKKWQSVYIDEAFVELWAADLKPIPVDSTALDACCLADSACCVADSACCRLKVLADSLLLRENRDFVQQYYGYWQHSDSSCRAIWDATHYVLYEVADSLSASADSLSAMVDSLSLTAADSLVDKKSLNDKLLPLPDEAKFNSNKEKLKTNKNLLKAEQAPLQEDLQELPQRTTQKKTNLKARPQELLLEAPAELSTDDGRGR